MKIIDGEHYVDGGPKCECVRERLMNPEEASRQDLDVKDKPAFWYIKPDCPICHGTGFLPVESWDADQCAGWIKKTTNCDGLNLFWFNDPEADGKIIWGIRICYEDAPPVEYKLGHHEDISDALCAAVIAVAKESK